LSANVVNQFNSWKRACQKLEAKAPDIYATWGKLAEAYQLRYLARRAIRSRNSKLALKLAVLAIKTNFRILYKEPMRTINTLLCAGLINLIPTTLFCRIEGFAICTLKLTGLLLAKHRKAELIG